MNALCWAQTRAVRRHDVGRFPSQGEYFWRCGGRTPQSIPSCDGSGSSATSAVPLLGIRHSRLGLPSLSPRDHFRAGHPGCERMINLWRLLTEDRLVSDPQSRSRARGRSCERVSGPFGGRCDHWGDEQRGSGNWSLHGNLNCRSILDRIGLPGGLCAVTCLCQRRLGLVH